MNWTQEYIIKFLNSAIRGKKIIINEGEKIDWKDILKEAREHNIESLIYSSIDKKSFVNIDEDILNEWKKDVFFSGVYQLNHIKHVNKILNEFGKENIPVMVLKGLIIRDLYPRAELRTMGDADLLVHKEDFERCHNILINLGYEFMHSSDKHDNYYKNGTHIELHKMITNEEYFNDILYIQNEIWKNSVEVSLNNNRVLSMSDEDMLLHLCLHMASHLIGSGFGIRQVCDLVLLVEKRRDLIDWNSFSKKIELCGIDKFTKVIFIVCRKLFDLEIPKELYIDVDKSIVDNLIDDIFSNGVHGKKDKVNMLGKTVAHHNFVNKDMGNFKTLICLLFPNKDNISERYDYIQKYNILLIVAWVHRFFSWFIRGRYSLIEIIKIIFCSNSIYKKRNILLKSLEL